MSYQFSEYADVECPSVKLVSAKQIKVFLTDNTFGIILYALVHAISPSLIKTPPRFQLRVTLGSNNSQEAFEYPRVNPSQKDYAFTSRITYPDGIEQSIAKSLDQTGIFPVKSMEGSIFFQVEKKPTQRILATYLELIE